ncbi:hypothetical protein IQ07DRAFT_606515 [Pyrenochaeta sp. DS3sAY3a]|nr:hypothetical protein IQ07DRAFT_606515 [Pyrenochaeta sp. DS3sAY3a]
MALPKPDWDMVAQTAQEQAAQYYPGNLVCLVQSFVLKMTIHILFARDLSALDDETISASRANPWAKQHKMHEALRQLAAEYDPLDMQNNAMNLILPAFETMWRVVFRCFIEVRFRGAEERKKWMEALRAYLKNPSPQSDTVCKDNADVALVRTIVREALRLYPLTWHIHRHFGNASGTSSLVTADIEGLHRDTEIWGDDAERFVPTRWISTSLETEDSKAWMPFGASPFLCPAKQDFGPS